jgi:hypothetical protein
MHKKSYVSPPHGPGHMARMVKKRRQARKNMSANEARNPLLSSHVTQQNTKINPSTQPVSIWGALLHRGNATQVKTVQWGQQ